MSKIDVSLLDFEGVVTFFEVLAGKKSLNESKVLSILAHRMSNPGLVKARIKLIEDSTSFNKSWATSKLTKLKIIDGKLDSSPLLLVEDTSKILTESEIRIIESSLVEIGYVISLLTRGGETHGVAPILNKALTEKTKVSSAPILARASDTFEDLANLRNFLISKNEESVAIRKSQEDLKDLLIKDLVARFYKVGDTALGKALVDNSSLLSNFTEEFRKVVNKDPALSKLLQDFLKVCPVYGKKSVSPSSEHLKSVFEYLRTNVSEITPFKKETYSAFEKAIEIHGTFKPEGNDGFIPYVPYIKHKGKLALDTLESQVSKINAVLTEEGEGLDASHRGDSHLVKELFHQRKDQAISRISRVIADKIKQKNLTSNDQDKSKLIAEIVSLEKEKSELEELTHHTESDEAPVEKPVSELEMLKASRDPELEQEEENPEPEDSTPNVDLGKARGLFVGKITEGGEDYSFKSSLRLGTLGVSEVNKILSICNHNIDIVVGKTNTELDYSSGWEALTNSSKKLSLAFEVLCDLIMDIDARQVQDKAEKSGIATNLKTYVKDPLSKFYEDLIEVGGKDIQAEYLEFLKTNGDKISSRYSQELLIRLQGFNFGSYFIKEYASKVRKAFLSYIRYIRSRHALDEKPSQNTLTQRILNPIAFSADDLFESKASATKDGKLTKSAEFHSVLNSFLKRSKLLDKYTAEVPSLIRLGKRVEDNKAFGLECIPAKVTEAKKVSSAIKDYRYDEEGITPLVRRTASDSGGFAEALFNELLKVSASLENTVFSITQDIEILISALQDDGVLSQMVKFLNPKAKYDAKLNPKTDEAQKKFIREAIAPAISYLTDAVKTIELCITFTKHDELQERLVSLDFGANEEKRVSEILEVVFNLFKNEVSSVVHSMLSIEAKVINGEISSHFKEVFKDYPSPSFSDKSDTAKARSTDTQKKKAPKPLINPNQKVKD